MMQFQNDFTVHVTADQRVYKDLQNGGPIKFQYAKNCKRCKRHKKTQRHFNKYDIHRQPLSKSMVTEDPDLHYMTVPRTIKRDWDPHMTLTSPIEWETSPLVNEGNSLEKTDNKDLILNDNSVDKPHISSKTEVENNNCDVEEPLQIENPQQKRQSRTRSESNAKHKSGTSSRKTTGTEGSVRRTSRSRKCDKNTIAHDGDDEGLSADVTEPFIVVNIPQNTFMDAQNHNIVATAGDDTATVVSDAVKCRYCLVGDTGHTSEPLISPCQCRGTSKYVHKSCLEKWLTLRNLDACEVCKTIYRTKWVHRKLCSLQFPSMKKHDVILLLLTIALYITLIFQLLGAVYISVMASSLPTMVTAVTLTGLAFGLFWFLPGSIALTIILYTSDYWRAWRNANRKKILILENETTANVNGTTVAFPQDLSLAVAV